MTTANDILKAIKNGGIDSVDLRFTDLKGKLQHMTLDGSFVDESVFTEGRDVRRLLDRWMEGNQRVGHGAVAGSDDVASGPNVTNF